MPHGDRVIGKWEVYYRVEKRNSVFKADGVGGCEWRGRKLFSLRFRMDCL